MIYLLLTIGLYFLFAYYNEKCNVLNKILNYFKTIELKREATDFDAIDAPQIDFASISNDNEELTEELELWQDVDKELLEFIKEYNTNRKLRRKNEN